MMMGTRFRKVALTSILIAAAVATGAVSKAWADKVLVEQTAEIKEKKDYLKIDKVWTEQTAEMKEKKDYIKMAEEITSSKKELKAVVSLLKKYEKIGGANGIYDGLWWADYGHELENAIKVFSMKELFDCFSKYKNAPSSMGHMAYWFRFKDKETAINLANFFSNDSIVSCITKVEKCFKAKGLVDDSIIILDEIGKGPISMDGIVTSFITIFENARAMAVPFAQYIKELAESPVEALRTAEKISDIAVRIKETNKISGENATKAVLDCLLKYKQSPQETVSIAEHLMYISFQGEEAVIAIADCLSKYYKAPRAAAQLAYWLERYHEIYPPRGGAAWRSSDDLIAAANMLANETVITAILKVDALEKNDGSKSVNLGEYLGCLVYDGTSKEAITKIAEEIISKAKTPEEAIRIAEKLVKVFEDQKNQ